MKPRLVFVALAACALFSAPAAAEEYGTPVRPNAGFDLMKALVGEWEAPGKDGKLSTISYSLVSSGTALMEKLGGHGMDAAMVTIYHADGDNLMMTHYCGANNQPRMRCAKPAAGSKSLTFEYVDSTNLPTPATGHMHRLVITFTGANHITHEWTWKEGEKTTTEVFQATRKKA
jgi:hypothetical protein